MNNFRARFLAALSKPILCEDLVIRPWQVSEAAIITDFMNADEMSYQKLIGWPGWDLPVDYTLSTILPHLDKFDNDANHVQAAVYVPDQSRIIGEMDFWQDNLGRDRLTPFVLPSERRGGIAKKAFAACLDWALDQGLVRSFYGEIELSNEASLALTKSLGFIEAGPVRSGTRNYEGQLLIAVHKSRFLDLNIT